MKAEVFLDSAYAIALAAPSDQLHAQAVDLANQLAASTSRIITTRAVTLEIGNALAKQRYRSAAVKLLNALDEDPRVTIVPLSTELYDKAFAFFRQRSDKDWGLIDCVSFVVMQERGMTDALTSDDHFVQAGFNALLRSTTSPT